MPFVFNSSTGQWEWEGDVPEEQEQQQAAPVATQEPPPPEEPPKRTAADGYEQEREARPWYEKFVGRYNPMFGGIDNLKNDLEYEYNTLTNPETAIPRVTQYLQKTVLGNTGLPDPVIDQFQLGAAKSQANAIKGLSDLVGLNTAENEGQVDQQLDNFYKAAGYRPPTEMTDEELAGDDARSTIVLNTMLAILTSGLSAKLQGSAFLAKNYPFLAKFLGLANVGGRKTLLGKTGAFTAGQVADEIPSTLLDDNTQGSAIQILGLLGMDPEQVNAIDPAVQPGLSRTEAAVRAFFPNLGGSLALAGSLTGLAAGLPATSRAIRSNWAKTRRERIRAAQVADNTITDPTQGKSTFTPETMEEAEAAFADRFGLNESPEKLEVDALEETIEATMDQEELAEVVARQEAGESTVEIVDDISQRDPIAPSRTDVGYEAVAAPKDSLLIPDAPISERFSNVPTATLRALADPANSPVLAQKITEITGRTPDQFDRLDVFAGIEAMEAVDGRTVMPSRLLSGDMLLVDELNVDVGRFQFKQGVDDAGRQRGRSLSGVKKFDEEADGLVQVWQDPADGKVYVVNGHNRVALAKQLKIPSLRVQYINARDAVVARAKGAMSNIKDDKGTIWDAAKFMRDSGIKDPQDLVDQGVPMSDSIGQKGFALSKLPDNIFIDAQNGRIKPTHAIALGDSGLDETGMQAVYKRLLARDMTIDTFNEVLDQIRYSVNVQGDQVDLFGNTEMLNLMEEKAALASRIRKDLSQTRRAATNATKNKDVLEGAGSSIDAEGATSLADDTAALLAQFDATKYSPGPISDLLNEGAIDINNGARLGVVADRIRRGIIEQAEKQVAAPMPKVEAEVEVAAPAPTRKELVRQVTRTAAKNGEVRAPSTVLPEAPKLGEIDPTQRIDKQALQILDDEARLREQLTEVDDAVAADKLRAERKASGYDEMTFEEKKQNGMMDGIDNGLTEKGLLRKLGITEEELSRRIKAGDVAEIEAALGRKLALEESTLYGKKFQLGEGVTRPIGNRDPKNPGKPSLDGAGRKITSKNRNRVQLTAELLYKWANMGWPDNPPIPSLNDAIRLVQNKGELFDPDRVPALREITDKASQDSQMGRIGYETDAISDAYRRFYGVQDPGLRKPDPFTATEQAQWNKRLKEGQERDKQARIKQDAEDLAARQQQQGTGYAIPRGLQGAKSRYRDARLEFESDLDKAAYIVRNSAKKSKRFTDYVKSIEDQGLPLAAVRSHGEVVKNYIRDEYNSGTTDLVRVPRQPYEGGGIQASRTGVQMSQDAPADYNEAAIRKQLERTAQGQAYAEEVALLDLGVALPDDAAELASLSPRLAKEMVEGLKDAARISGLDPLRIQYLDQISTRKMFGDNEANASLSAWSPELAEFARRNPGDPLVQIADGTTGGLYVPKDHQSIHRHMIYLSFGYVLDNRISKNMGLGFTRAGQKPIGWTAYHESFHAVQDWLREMIIDSKTSTATKMDAAKMWKAIHSDEALAEMTELLKKDKWATFVDGMAPDEIQAEAFAQWFNNRKIRMKSPGLQAAFEYFKKFINTLRRKWGKALGKDPSWVDVFELAAEGKIGSAGNAKVKGLRPEQLERLKNRMTRNMDQMMPQLTDRIHDYLQAKKAAFDQLNEEMAIKIKTQGCN